MTRNNDTIHAEVAKYYSGKLSEHGESPRGVDWNGEEGQTLRFVQLSKVIAPDRQFSINDIGCGYGAYYDFLSTTHRDFSYVGTDISNDMVVAARNRHAEAGNAKFLFTERPAEPADYSVASGIFNVRMERTDSEWLDYVKATLDVIAESSREGFSFNCLTSYSDRDKMRDYLYYTDPAWAFDFCKRRYSPHVALLHDYGLYEFTILVRQKP
ncbi:class I SAM-dependent methyltransferase [Paraburkholderia youngii]|uniref:class I SAM-dependent methyltransferase n=1 Tax=Paraburkholderia youngii TaxID=2782701 RepID=UPI001591B226|nr:class I SAM-dependent methyltransferase [Paraburkholderia youngii]NUX58236.1 class I SAM-dependent methyltransferase [Paraburkholderia youngii]